jgi:hypothetical protein
MAENLVNTQGGAVTQKTGDRLAQYQKGHQWFSELITNTSMLSDEDRNVVKYSLNKEWANPKYKLRWFVGQAQVTPFSKLRQWMLEIKSKEETIEQLEYEIAKFEIETERTKRLAETTSDEFDRRLHELELRKNTINQTKSLRRLNDWYLERQQLVDLVNEFLATDEAKLPDGTGRTYMDILNTDEEDIYEREYWTNRLGKQAACDLLFYGRIGTGNMDAILSMDPGQQTETLGLAINYATQLQQVQNGIQKEVDENLGLANASFNHSSLSMPKTAEDLTKQNLPTPEQGDDLDVYSS